MQNLCSVELVYVIHFVAMHWITSCSLESTLKYSSSLWKEEFPFDTDHISAIISIASIQWSFFCLNRKWISRSIEITRTSWNFHHFILFKRTLSFKQEQVSVLSWKSLRHFLRLNDLFLVTERKSHGENFFFFY